MKIWTNLKEKMTNFHPCIYLSYEGKRDTNER
jgi:hypothetical protein